MISSCFAGQHTYYAPVQPGRGVALFLISLIIIPHQLVSVADTPSAQGSSVPIFGDTVYSGAFH